MMSVAPVASAGDAAGYYMSSDNYYFLGNLQSLWIGEGAKALGLEGAVRGDNLTAVLHGFLDNGERLGREIDGNHVHRAGHDLTFSAPKSVSVLALIGNDKGMLEAHNQAVEIAAGYVEKLISARDTRDGITSIVPTGKMVAAAFTHDTSRNLDPQLHTHLIVANMTESDGKWKALATDYIHNAGFIETVMKMQVTLGKIYRNALRERVEALGHEIEEVSPHGMWEIKGVPEEVREEFSSRGKEIEGAVGAEATLRSRDVAAKDTRQAKVDPSRLRLMERWNQQMRDKGFDLHDYMRTAAERAVPPGMEREQPGQHDRAEISNAVMMAVSHLSDSKTRFTWGELLLATTEFSDRLPDAGELKASINTALKEGIIIPLDSEKGVFTSRIHLLDELSIQALSKEHLQSWRVVSFERTAPPAPDTLRNIETDALVLINAPSGVAGIRDLTRTLAESGTARGRDVRGLASSAERAASLAKAEELKDKLIGRPQLLSGEFSLKPQSTLIVEGAERLGLKETLVLLGEAREKNAQLIFLDSAGRQANGNAMSVLESAGVSRTRYNMQVTGLETTVQSIADKRDRYDALATRYAELSGGADAVTAVVIGQREQKHLTSLIRDALQNAGQLERDSVTVETRTPVWLDSKTRKMTGSYRPGQVLEDRSDARETRHFVIDRVHEETRRHPEPAIAIRLFDQNGKNAGLALVSLVASETGRLTQGETRMVATDGVQAGILQQSRSGETRVAASFDDALATARKHPRDGVVWQTGDVPPSESLLRLTRGAVVPDELRLAAIVSELDKDIRLPALPVTQDNAENLVVTSVLQAQNESAELQALVSQVKPDKPDMAKPEAIIPESALRLPEEHLPVLTESDKEPVVNSIGPDVLRRAEEATTGNADDARAARKAGVDLDNQVVPETGQTGDRQLATRVAGEMAEQVAAEKARMMPEREQGRMPEHDEHGHGQTRHIQKER